MSCKTRALNKSEYMYLVIIKDNFCKFCINTYVVTPHLNRLDDPHLNHLNEMVQMRGHNIWF